VQAVGAAAITLAAQRRAAVVAVGRQRFIDVTLTVADTSPQRPTQVNGQVDHVVTARSHLTDMCIAILCSPSRAERSKKNPGPVLPHGGLV